MYDASAGVAIFDYIFPVAKRPTISMSLDQSNKRANAPQVDPYAVKILTFDYRTGNWTPTGIDSNSTTVKDGIVSYFVGQSGIYAYIIPVNNTAMEPLAGLGAGAIAGIVIGTYSWQIPILCRLTLSTGVLIGQSLILVGGYMLIKKKISRQYKKKLPADLSKEESPDQSVDTESQVSAPSSPVSMMDEPGSINNTEMTPTHTQPSTLARSTPPTLLAQPTTTVRSITPSLTQPSTLVRSTPAALLTESEKSATTPHSPQSNILGRSTPAALLTQSPAPIRPNKTSPAMASRSPSVLSSGPVMQHAGPVTRSPSVISKHSARSNRSGPLGSGASPPLGRSMGSSVNLGQTSDGRPIPLMGGSFVMEEDDGF